MNTETIPMVTATAAEQTAASREAFSAIMRIVRDELDATSEQRSAIINHLVLIESAEKWRGWNSGYAAGFRNAPARGHACWTDDSTCPNC